MKIDLDDHNGGPIEFSIGATRKELYSTFALIIYIVQWICRHF